MKRIQSALMASLLTVVLSSAAMAGNIGGMRTTSIGESGAQPVSTSGNIGGPSAKGNIAGLGSDTMTRVVGNIGGLLRVVFSTSTIW
jgi:hypothetical protein